MERKRVGLAIMGIFVLAVVVRLDGINHPYFSLQPVREYRSSIIARAYYQRGVDDIPAWQREIAAISRERESLLEPPLMEWLTAQLYRLIGGEQVWAPRLLSTLFWLAGGLFLLATAFSLLSPPGAILATAFYLIAPLGIVASQGFIPDPLMILFFLASLWAIVRYDSRPSWPRLLLAAVIAGIGFLVKPLCLFTVFCAFAALTVHRYGWRGLFRRQTGLFVGITLLPIAVYYLYGIYGDGFLAQQAAMSFMPHLLRLPMFWKEWLLLAVASVGLAALLGALLGFALLPPDRSRALMLGLGVGYVLFGLTFTYHIHTHDYYHLQLIPIVGLGLGALLAHVGRGIARSEQGRLRWAVVAAALLLIVTFSLRDARERRSQVSFESQALAQTIGDLVHHSSQVAYVARYYGRPLEYFGLLSGTYWPRANNSGIYNPGGPDNLSVTDRLDALGFEPRYFVITDLAAFSQYHADLAAYLQARCDLLASEKRYLIYETCTPPASG